MKIQRKSSSQNIDDMPMKLSRAFFISSSFAVKFKMPCRCQDLDGHLVEQKLCHHRYEERHQNSYKLLKHEEST